MKKQFFITLMMLTALTVVGQKTELKTADRALKKGDLAAAQTAISQAEKLIANSQDNKLIAKFYFLKGKTYAEIAKKQPNLAKDAYDTASASLTNLLNFEKKINKKVYSEEAAPLFNTIIADLRNMAINDYKSKKYKESALEFNKIYLLSPKDTFMLDNAANAAYLAKANKLALDYYLKLADLNYTGVSEVFKAKNIESGKFESFGSKAQLDLMIKSGKYSDAKDEFTKSRKNAIVKNIAYMYGQLGETEKGLAAIKKARELEPDDYNLLLAEADLQIKIGNRTKFGELMNEAVRKNPKEPVLYFNLGVINSEQNKDKEAINDYKKAIELKDDYFDAYVNLANVYRKRESPIIDEMNKNMSDFDKYDKLKLKLTDLYKVVLPLYEKAYTLKGDDISVIQTLMGIYENLEMEAKYKVIKAKYDTLRN